MDRSFDREREFVIDPRESIRTAPPDYGVDPWLIEPVLRFRPPYPLPPILDAAGRNERISRLIIAGDLGALRRYLPEDPVARNVVIREADALGTVAVTGRLAVFNQLLQWNPTLLAELPDQLRHRAMRQASYGMVTASQVSPNDSPDNVRLDDQLVIFRRVLDSGANPDGDLGGDERVLMKLVFGNPVPQLLEAIRLVVGKGATFADAAGGVNSPLRQAAKGGSVKMVNAMLEGRVLAPEQLDNVIRELDPSNPALEPLLRARGSAKALHQKQPTPALTSAAMMARRGHPTAMRTILQYPVDDNPPAWATTALEVLVLDDEFRPMLLKAGSDPNRRSAGWQTMAVQVPTGGTALAAALYISEHALSVPEPGARVRAVRDLLAAGAQLRGTGVDAQGALLEFLPDDADLVDLLLARGLEVTVPESWKARLARSDAPVGPISWAVLNHKDFLASALLTKGARVSKEDCGAIYYASLTGSVRTLELLLARKVPGSNLRDKDGMTPLLVAASTNRPDSVQLLLKHKASSANEAVPRKVALIGGHGGPPIPGMVGGETALMWASSGGHLEVARLLVKAGADLEAKDARGRTALQHARSQEMRVLLQVR